MLSCLHYASILVFCVNFFFFEIYNCGCFALLCVCIWELQVMLLGHDDNNIEDKIMQITIAYNHFGEGLVERMPR